MNPITLAMTFGTVYINDDYWALITANLKVEVTTGEDAAVALDVSEDGTTWTEVGRLAEEDPDAPVLLHGQVCALLWPGAMYRIRNVFDPLNNNLIIYSHLQPFPTPCPCS